MTTHALPGVVSHAVMAYISQSYVSVTQMTQTWAQDAWHPHVPLNKPGPTCRAECWPYKNNWNRSTPPLTISKQMKSLVHLVWLEVNLELSRKQAERKGSGQSRHREAMLFNTEIPPRRLGVQTAKSYAILCKLRKALIMT